MWPAPRLMGPAGGIGRDGYVITSLPPRSVLQGGVPPIIPAESEQ